MIETLFRALIIVQPFFWMLVLERPDWFSFLEDGWVEVCFNLFVLIWIVGIWFFEVSIGFYSTELLLVYPLIVWGGVGICYQDFKYEYREALAISFLVAYLNSWYWEGILHLWAIFENGLNLNQVYQMIHLIPALYFLVRWDFEVRMASNSLMKGWLVSGLITFTRKTRFWVVWGVTLDQSILFNHGLMILNRIICFYFLIEAIARYGLPKKFV